MNRVYPKKRNGNGNGNGSDVMELIKLEEITKSPNQILKRNIKIKCKNEKQKEFIKLIDNNQIILCDGPSGCGKSHLSILKSLSYLTDENTKYNKIYILTPTVEITKNGVGFLPGSFSDKVSMFMHSVYNLFDKIIGKENSDKLLKENIIEILGLGYIRGENLDNCLLIVDEAQNISKKEMLTILTRIGSNCKMIISGDIMQIDNFKNKEESGLYHAIQNLKDINDIGIFKFTIDDIVRNTIINKILEKY